MFMSRVHHWLLQICAILVLASQCAPPSTLLFPSPQPTIESHPGLAYYSQRPDPDSMVMGGLYVMNFETKEERSLTPGSNVDRYMSTFRSSVTRRLVYAGGATLEGMELYLVDLDGHKVQLTENDVEDGWGDWAPNGKSIAFLSRRHGDEQPDIYLMNPDGSDVRRVFDDTSIRGGSFAWSPDSRKLAVSTISQWSAGLPSPKEELRVVNIETKEELLHLSDGRTRFNLDWSHDSSKLVYLSDYVVYQNIPVYTKLYVLDIHTGQETLIANLEAISNPRWSPVEDVIAFAGGTSEEMNVYLIKSDGTNLRQLTDGGFYSVGSWSPDGDRLALTAIGDNLQDSEIYTLDTESKSLEQVTENNVFDAYPMWVELGD
jgi:Tol biopolymer transport system component